MKQRRRGRRCARSMDDADSIPTETMIVRFEDGRRMKITSKDYGHIKPASFTTWEELEPGEPLQREANA